MLTTHFVTYRKQLISYYVIIVVEMEQCEQVLKGKFVMCKRQFLLTVNFGRAVTSEPKCSKANKFLARLWEVCKFSFKSLQHSAVHGLSSSRNFNGHGCDLDLWLHDL